MTKNENPNRNHRFYGQKSEGACRHCGELIWANSDAKAVHLAGKCILSRDEAEQSIRNLLTSNFEAGLIDEATYKAALAGLDSAK